MSGGGGVSRFSKSGTDLSPLTTGDDILLPDGDKLQLGTGKDGTIYSSSDDLYIENDTQDKDIILKVNKGGADTEVMRLFGTNGVVQIEGGNFILRNTSDVALHGVQVYSSTSTNYPATIFRRSASDTLGTALVTVDTSEIGRIEWQGVNDDAGGDAFIATASIQVIQNGSVGAGDTRVPSDMVFYTSPGVTTSQQERMRIDKNGAVSIGGIAPASGAEFEVYGTGVVTNTTLGFSTTAGDSPVYLMRRSRNATKGTKTVTADGDFLGKLDFQGVNDAAGGDDYADGAYIYAIQNGTVSASDTTVPTDLVFATSPGVTTEVTEHLRLNKNGHLTLTDGHYTSAQTTAPTATLTSTTLNDGAGSGAAINVTAGSTDNAGSITVTAGNGTPGAGIAGQIVFNIAYTSTPKAVIVTSKDADGVDNQIYISALSTASFQVSFNTALGTSEAVEFYYWVIA